MEASAALSCSVNPGGPSVTSAQESAHSCSVFAGVGFSGAERRFLPSCVRGGSSVSSPSSAELPEALLELLSLETETTSASVLPAPAPARARRLAAARRCVAALRRAAIVSAHAARGCHAGDCADSPEGRPPLASAARRARHRRHRRHLARRARALEGEPVCLPAIPLAS